MHHRTELQATTIHHRLRHSTCSLGTGTLDMVQGQIQNGVLISAVENELLENTCPKIILGFEEICKKVKCVRNKQTSCLGIDLLNL